MAAMKTPVDLMKSILDPTFRYRPSHATDIRKTFERVREQLAQANQQRVVSLKVSPLLRKEKS
jgi:hypothetical protein